MKPLAQTSNRRARDRHKLRAGTTFFALLAAALGTSGVNATPITFTGSGAITDGSKWSGGSPTFNVEVADRWNINGTTTYTSAQGITTLSEGRGLVIASGDATSGSLTITGGTIKLTNADTALVSAPGTGTASGTLILSGGNVTTPGEISILARGSAAATGTLTVNAGSTLSAGSVSFGKLGSSSGTGTINVNTGGTIIAGSFGDVSPVANSRINLDGGVLKGSAAGNSDWIATSIEVLNIGASGATFDTNGASQTIKPSGGISGSGSINITGGGTAVLSTSNSYSGITTVSSGTLVLGTNTALGNTEGSSVVTSGSVHLKNGVKVTGETIAIANGGTGSNGALSTVLGESAEWAGGVLLNNSARIGSNGGGVLTISGAIQNGSANTLNIGTGYQSLNAGAVILSASNNSYTGGTNIIRGVLKIGANNALPTATTLAVDSTDSANETSTFDLNGYNQTVAGLTRNDGGTGGSFVTNNGASDGVLTINGTGTYSGIIQDGSKKVLITKSGSGTLTLSTANTYTGVTTISGGTLVLGDAGTISNSPEIVVGSTGSSGAILNVTGKLAFTIGASQTLSGIGTVNIGSGKTVTIAGTHAPGNSTGSQSITGNLGYAPGSIFDWELNAVSGDAGSAPNQGAYDQVVVSGNLTGTTSEFNISLLGNSFSDPFWNSNKSWNNIFTAAGSTDLQDIFNSFSGAGVATNGVVEGQGAFAFSGSTLNWTAVPEPGGALAGLLVASGLLRRRRSCI